MAENMESEILSKGVPTKQTPQTSELGGYEKLAFALLQDLNLKLLINSKLAQIDRSLPKILRTTQFFELLLKNEVRLSDVANSLLKPKKFKFNSKNSDLSRDFIGPLLKQIRGSRSVRIYCEKFKISNPVTYHYWEKGSRDIPLAEFLKIVDQVAKRLNTLCDAIGFKQDVREFGLKAYGPNLSYNYFSEPWTPTVHLFLRTKAYSENLYHEDSFVAQQLKITAEQVKNSLQILCTLDLVMFNGTHYVCKPSSIYSPPNLNSEIIEKLNHYWFGRAYDFVKLEGLHKLDQATMSYESFENIKTWVAELRTKIRNEIQSSQPEILVHMNWQVFNLLNEQKESVNK